MIRELHGQNAIIWNRWLHHALAHPDRDAVVHWTAGAEPYRWTFSSLITAAEGFAAMLLEHGIQAGDVCAVIIRHHRDFYPLYLGIACVGGIPAILAYPNPRLHPDKFRQGLVGMSRRSGLDWILTERELGPLISPLLAESGGSIKGALFPLTWDRRNATLSGERLRRVVDIHRQTEASAPLLLQHSSGTTGLQKPVLLSHRAVLQHVDAYAAAIGLRDDDKVISWLPLYHDMGLIAAFHLPLACGIPMVQLDPFEWVCAPGLLLEAVSKEGGTLSWLPNFAYNMMADKIMDEELEGVSLASWRLVINCSEPIRQESHDRFLSRFRPYGLKPAALAACYAMAETTFAVTQSRPGHAPTAYPADRGELARGRAVRATPGREARTCVSSGQSIAGCTVRIVDADRHDLPPNRVGEIAVRSSGEDCRSPARRLVLQRRLRLP
jgi:acyl-CoA synthetase (AMP-forming)/AMP-acid ligase II